MRRTTRPGHAINFLRDWKNGAFPQGWDNRPVTWVSLEDARAYAKWAGKRLPHEWEWQLAAQGTDGRIYPWGNQWQAANVPTPTQAAPCRPDPVDAHPQGASPYGVMDMVGNVWQWTDEFTDEHTRGGHPARRRILPAAGLHLVLSPRPSATMSTASCCCAGEPLRCFSRRDLCHGCPGGDSWREPARGRTLRLHAGRTAFGSRLRTWFPERFRGRHPSHRENYNAHPGRARWARQ
jgi:hypothetical protein